MGKKRIRLAWVFACLCCAMLTGCSMFGIVVHKPVVVIQNVAVPLPQGSDITALIQRSAHARRWTTSVTAPDVVRCTLAAHSWRIVVDVRHSGPSFSIEYVETEGLFYRPELQDIHSRYNRSVEALRQRILRDAAKFIPPQPVAAPVYVVAPDSSNAVPQSVTAPRPAVPYTIELFEREGGDGFSYRFVLAISDSAAADLTLSRRIQADLREAVRADYAAATSTKNLASLRIEFPQYAIKDGKVEGRAQVMAVELLEFVYDPETAHGRLVVKVNPQQYELTRQWVRENIATLAHDKNATLFGIGKPRFTIGREDFRKDEQVLEVEFQTGK